MSTKAFNLFFIIACVCSVLLNACTSVTYSPMSKLVQDDFPEIGKPTTINHGEKMVLQGAVFKQPVLHLDAPIDGVMVDFPEGDYPAIGQDDKNMFFSLSNIQGGIVTEGTFADKLKSLMTVKADRRKSDREVCAISVYNATTCYEYPYTYGAIRDTLKTSRQKTIIFHSVKQGLATFLYQEFQNNDLLRRESFEVNLNETREINYGGVKIRVLNFSDTSITYVVDKNFNLIEQVELDSYMDDDTFN